jgi:predicted RecB family nuclease
VYADDNGLVLSPTDLTKHLACAHLTTLDLASARHELYAPQFADEELELIFRLGNDHEAAYLQTLRERGFDVVDIPTELELPQRVQLTDKALRAGAEVIHQATFLHDGHRGHADFLLRVDRPSALGAHSYDVADTKLARKLKVAALLQMADYGRHLERIQGHPPELLTVVTGDGEERTFRYADAAAYAQRATDRLRDAVEAPVPTVPVPAEHCGQCRWSPRCETQWRKDDHLSLVAFMRGDHRVQLEAAGIHTVVQLAAADPAALPKTIGESSRIRLQAQASLQILERETGEPQYEILEPADGLGLLRLPEPSDGDVYLDFEGDPYAEGIDGREYLAGLWDAAGNYTTYWAHSKDEERELTKQLLADLVARFDTDPGMHIYHYAPYERTALAKLTQRHGVGEQDFDRLLRGERLVDLYAVVRQGLRISKGSYSIKKLEAFYWGGVRGSGDQPDDVADAMSSVLAYERWLISRDQSILDGIAAYNRDDVRSACELHVWLEERHAELVGKHGAKPRPELTVGAASEALSAAEAVEAALALELEQAGQPLLAGLVGWHRREGKPQWWDFYRLGALTDDELIRDSAALGEVSEPILQRVLPPPLLSTIWRYKFPPQDTKVRGDAYDVDTHKSIGKVFEMDAGAGWLDIKLGSKRTPASVRGLGPQPPVDVRVLQESLLLTGREVLDGSVPLGQRLLERSVPTGLEPLPGEEPCDVVVRAGRQLQDAVLAVQGPPGSGKTTAGAALIEALLDDGLRVGITAQSHSVIGTLLKKVGRPALQKCTEDEYCGAPGVEIAKGYPQVLTALGDGTHRLVGGTAWMWARPDMAAAVDVLVIDEAGQFSLANAVAVSRCASRGLVLLGDPQQLAQPSQAQHPEGAGDSVLDHFLERQATIPPDRGVFLDRSWRMHPAITAAVSDLMYEGRLASAPGREQQVVVAPAPWGGAGVRWVPVTHAGNEAASREEVTAVRAIVDELVGTQWVDCEGVTHPLELDDVLVVAPYNSHVGYLRAGLPPGARVGTVDKFQGKEAPVVIYSMASSSAEDAPRGVSFLYDLHRLNVAISRGQCLAIVVGSPALLSAAVGTPEQLCMVNGFIKTVGESSLVSY